MSEAIASVGAQTALWDPLPENSPANGAVVAAAKRREIRNILKSYVGLYDPLCEMLQNAMDAVDARAAIETDTSYRKHLWITIDLSDNSVTVVDNGVGFTEEAFQLFLSPSISFKDSRTSRGRKGVGATYLAFGFDGLTIGTRAPGYEQTAEIVDGHKWVTDELGQTPKPMVRRVTIQEPVFQGLERGSIFRLRFGGEGTRPRDLSWPGAQTAEQWRHILLWKTPLGHLSAPSAPGSDVLFDLTVVARDGGTTTLADQDCQYLYPHEVIGNSLAAGAIIDELQRRLARGQDVTRLAPRFYQRNGLYAFYDSAALAGLLGARGAAEMAVLAAHGATAYAYFAYSTSVWDALNDTTAQLRPGMRLLRGGLQMAAQHMPQGDEITIPLTSNIGYQKQVLVVVHFADAEPDLGRKGFQPELRHAAEVASVAIVNLLKKQRRFLKADSGAGAQILQQGDLHKWITDQERHEATAPMELSHPEFFVPINRIAITAAPQSEQDVIVLFNQLLAGGVIRGIRVLATSQHEQYDGVFRYVVEEPIAHHEFDEALNPLGVEVGKYQSPYRSRPYVLEYKFSVDGLVHEFESGDKHEGNVNLVVAWRMDQEWRQRYEVTSLLDLRHLSAREFHGQTHVFRDSASGDIRFYGVILSELIDYLNNVHGVQAAQATTYDETEH